MTDLDPRILAIMGSTRLEGGDLDDATDAELEQIIRGELSADDAVLAALARHGIASPTG